MASVSMVAETDKALRRPLRVLVPLIKEDFRNASEAADRAAMPYYQAAGNKISEARPQMSLTELYGWTRRNFDIGKNQTLKYLKLGDTTADLSGARTMSDALRTIGIAPRGADRGGAASWHDPVKQIIGRVDVDLLNRRQAELNRAEERDAQRKLALQLIDIGYKALATKLHPDKGGSQDAMTRLNQVRDHLKANA